MVRQDVLRRAYATLLSLKKNLPDHVYIHEKYVHEFHRILRSLEEQDFSLEEFRIPAAEVRKRLASINAMTGEETYSDDNSVERPIFMTKLDALLGYFSIVVDDRKPTIGFKSS